MDALQEAKENYKDAQEFFQEQYDRIKADFKFSNPSDPQQWDDIAIKSRAGRPTHTLDRTNQFVQHVVNSHRESKTSADILPADSKADVEVAKRIKGIIRHIEYVSRADIAWDTASDHQARGGLGWVRVLPKIVDPETNEQEIVIQRIHDPLSCLLDPNSTEPDGSDAMFGFVESSITKTAFNRLYPKAKEQDWDSQGWFSDKTVRIAEYFKVTEKKENRIVVDNQSQRMVLTEDQYWDIDKKTGIRLPVSGTFMAKSRKVMWSKMTGLEILEETEFPSQWIGIVPVIGHEIWIEGKRYLCGLVRRLIDGQKLHNYEMSALTESLMVQPKAPFLVPGRAVDGYENEWQALNSSNPAYLPYNDLDDQGQPVTQPIRLSPPGFPAAYANSANLAVQEMEASVGMYKSNLGIQSNAVSGRAKMADKEAGETATFHFLDNRRLSQQQVYRIVVDMLPRIYDSRRQAKIMGEDGNQSTVEINPQLETATATQGGKVVAINPGVGRYDVRVKVGPSYTTLREEMGVKLQELGKGNPVLAAALTPILMKLSDMPEADRISRIAVAMLPPEVQKAYHDEEQGDLPPQAKAIVDRQGQQIQQMSQAMDQAGKVIQDLQSQLNDKNNEVKAEATKAISDIKIAQEKLKNDAEKLNSDRQMFDKDKQIAKLQLELDLRNAVETVKAEKEAEKEVEPEEDDTMIEDAIKSLNESILKGQEMIAQMIEQQSQSINQLQQVTVSALENMENVAETVLAPRKITVQRDKSGKISGAVSSMQE